MTGKAIHLLMSAAGVLALAALVASPANAQQANAGDTPTVSTGQVGQRQTAAQAPANIKPTARLSSRIENRIDSRIRNRIEPGQKPQASASASIVAARRAVTQPAQ